MDVVVRLRGHHLLCLLGYRGMGYSKDYVENMTRVHKQFRREPETEIVLVNGPDDLCAKFPSSEPCHCEDDNIFTRDAAILQQLEVKVGQRLQWSVLEQKIARHVVSGDINRLCHSCSWRSYGVCEQGVTDLRAGRGLRPVE